MIKPLKLAKLDYYHSEVERSYDDTDIENERLSVLALLEKHILCHCNSCRDLKAAVKQLQEATKKT